MTRGPSLAFNGNGFTFGKFMCNMELLAGRRAASCLFDGEGKGRRKPPETGPREPLCEAQVTPGGY